MKIMRTNRTRNIFLFVAMVLSTTALCQQAATNDINANYKSSSLDVQEWVDRFEVEGREVYDFRFEIVKSLGIDKGDSIADVGAGTGLFIPLFADAVGKSGTVYAVDIAPRFIEHIQKRTSENGLDQVKTVLNSDKSVNLPVNSVDIVFTSDVYHHFVYYEDMLASIHAALKEDGEFIVVEFDMVPGQSSEFLQQHIRATKEVFTAEIEAAGFSMVEDMTLDGLEETFMRRFVKK